jgi:uncharacterized protein YbbK (DUF523 family)
MNKKEYNILREAINNNEKILVSGCLLGMMINYEEKGHLIEELRNMMLRGQAIPVCPEVLATLPTPRDPSEIRLINGERKVFNNKGVDMTETFKLGAERTLEVAKHSGAKLAIMKSNSPSCGSGKIYDGTFSGKRIDGDGFAVELLKKNGIVVITENEFKECIK